MISKNKNFVIGFIHIILNNWHLYHNRRINSVVMVAALHVLLFAMLVYGLRGGLDAVSTEYVMSLSGVAGAPHDKPIRFVMPEMPDAAPPMLPADLVLNVPPHPQTAITRNVSRPAEALANAHTFPKLPAEYHSASHAPVLLLILIAEDGSITDVRLRKSCGSAELDRLAMDWVRRYWRYNPALLNGRKVAEKAVAIVRFI